MVASTVSTELDSSEAVTSNPVENSVENGSKSSPEQPDQDTIKMFVGQVPRTMDENELRGMFEEFGPVYQINVLRDKITGQSKGKEFMSKYIITSSFMAQWKNGLIKSPPFFSLFFLT